MTSREITERNYHRQLLTLLLIFNAFAVFAQVPKIASFSPTSGPIGTTVTISGANFGTSAVNNTVFFGDVKATIIQASSTSIRVTVPFGAANKPISVLTSNLYATHQQHFQVSYNDGQPFYKNAFDLQPSVGTGAQYGANFSIATADFDGDGKVDLVTTGEYVTSMFVYKNNGTATPFSTSPLIITNAVVTDAASDVSTVDINNDGKPDIAVLTGNYVSIFLNRSTVGNIAFANRITVRLNSYPTNFFIEDIDDDGKADIVIDNGKKISVFRNQSTLTTVSFDAVKEITFDVELSRFSKGDIDGDGKIDFVFNGRDGFYIFKNTSTPGNFSFEKKREYKMKYPQSWRTAIGDLDGDGLVDLAVVDDQELQFYKNLGDFTFSITSMKLPYRDRPYGIYIADLNGDLKNDMVLLSSHVAIILRNNGTGSNISFVEDVDYTLPTYPHHAVFADFNGDGRTDIAVGTDTKVASIMMNQNNAPSIHSFSLSENGKSVTIKGQHFIGTTSVSVENNNLISFQVNSDTEIVANLTPNLSGILRVVSANGIAKYADFSNELVPVINSFSPKQAPSGTALRITGKYLNNGNQASIVQFGHAKAKIISASDEQIEVVVPHSATFNPIIVYSNRLRGLSKANYNLTFGDGSADLAAPDAFKLHNTKLITSHQLNFLEDMLIEDFNADGFADMVTYVDYKFRIYLHSTNTSAPYKTTPNLIIDTERISTNSGTFAIGDIDGDGLPDILFQHKETGMVVMKNTSDGNLSFEKIIINNQFAIPNYFKGTLLLSDLDGDGRLDLIYYGHLGIITYRNNSTANKISFLPSVQLAYTGPLSETTAWGYGTVQVADLNGDGKPEIIAGHNSEKKFIVFKNNSTKGDISFARDLEPAISLNYNVTISDIDGDDKPEILYTYTLNNANYLAVLKNTSTATNFNFEELKFPDINVTSDIRMGDLDGDGKPDLITSAETSGYQLKKLYLYKNTSSPSNLSFERKATFTVGGDTKYVGFADFNHDGKLDFAVGERTGQQYKTPEVSIYLNQLYGTTSPIINAFAPEAAAEGGEVTITGNNLSDVQSVSFGTTPASSFKVLNATTISAIVGKGSSGEVSITTSMGSSTMAGFTFLTNAAINDFSPKTAAAGTSVTITGTNLLGATAVSFGGVPAKSFTISSANTIIAVLNTGASGEIKVTTPAGEATIQGFVFLSPPSISSFSPQSAAKGATVTITGTNLQDVTSISFGGVAAKSFTVVSATSVKAIVDQGASGEITLTTANGEAKLNGFDFIAAPIINSFAPTVAVQGTELVISGSNFSDVTSLSIGDNVISDFTIVSANSISVKIVQAKSGSISLQGLGGVSSLSGFVFVPKPIISHPTPSQIITGNSITISIPTIEGLNMRWKKDGVLISGANKATYVVTSSGVYKASYSYNNVSVDSDPLTVEEIVAQPIITASGPLTFEKGGKVTLSTNDYSHYSYQWYKNGNEISGANRASLIVTESGNYNVKVSFSNHSKQSETTTVTAIFVMPVNNYKVSSTAISCKGQLDGSIEIKATRAFNYQTEITGPKNLTLRFTENLKVSELPAGDYNVCLTIIEEPNYKQCFSLKITEPKSLYVFSSINPKDNSLDLTLDGGTFYYINLNGKTYTTSNSSFNLPLTQATNNLSVSTDKGCQGTISQTIATKIDREPYPNPAKDFIYLDLGNAKIASTSIKLYDLSGKLIRTNNYTNVMGTVTFDLKGLPDGTYSLILTKDNVSTAFKILKK